MTNEAAFVFGVITIASVLMASNRARFDIVALFVVIVLMLICRYLGCRTNGYSVQSFSMNSRS